MAEALLNARGGGRFQAFSAGSHPKGQVHPLALETLRRHAVPTGDPRSKSWDVFAAPAAPAMEFIFTVCDNAAGEICPLWPGRPVTAHWSVADPAAVEGSERERQHAFDEAFQDLDERIRQFIGP